MMSTMITEATITTGLEEHPISGGHSIMVNTDKFNPNIHGARGLFAMMVFWYHVVNSGLAGFEGKIYSSIDHYFFHSFNFGVELFFGISGYVIVGALRRAPSVKSFLWDRATRIYPVLWLTLVGITVISLLTHRWLPSLWEWALNFIAPPPFYDLHQVNPAAWSLGYELTFYALCALAFVFRRSDYKVCQVAIYVVGAVLLCIFPRAILMPAGIMIAAGVFKRPTFAPLLSLPLVFLVGFLLLWRYLNLLNNDDIRSLTPLFLPLSDWLASLPLVLLAFVFGALALAGIAHGRGLLSAVLRTRPLQWLGTVSYSFYLWSAVVMGFVKLGFRLSGLIPLCGHWAQLAFALASLPATLLVSRISHLLIEVRLTKKLRRRGPQDGSHRVPITATVQG